MTRRGFALLTVLWLMVGSAVLAMAMELAAHSTLSAASNRGFRERALWRATDCLERARAVIDARLAEGVRDHTGRRIWRSLDVEVAGASLLSSEGCETWLTAAGSRLDVNAATDAQLRAVARSIAIDTDGRLAALLLEYRPFAHLQQLVRLDQSLALEALEAVLTVEPGRISLNHAPAAVLETVPGFTQELIARILLDRENGMHVVDIASVAGRVSRDAADSVGAHYPEVVQLTTADPEAWIVSVRGHAGTPELSVRMDARLVLDDSRAALARRRVLP